MYNYILSAGLTVVANGAFDNNVDIESTAGRQLVYRGLRAWQRDVFAANERGLISDLEKVRIFSEVKTVAVDNYNIAREELVNNVVEETIVVIDEVAELKAQLAAMQADNNVKANEIKNLNRDKERLEEKVGTYQAIIGGLKARTVVIGNVITKVLVSNKVGI